MIGRICRRLALFWLAFRLDSERGAMTRCLNERADADNELSRQAWTERATAHAAMVDRIKRQRAALRGRA